MLDDGGKQGARADGQPGAGVAGDPGTGLDILEIDHPLGRGDLILDPAEQVGSTGERGGVLTV